MADIGTPSEFIAVFTGMFLLCPRSSETCCRSCFSLRPWRPWWRGFSVTRRPGTHQMLPDALRQAQFVNLEHANQVITRGGGLNHRLRRKHRSKAPHVRFLLD